MNRLFYFLVFYFSLSIQSTLANTGQPCAWSVAMQRFRSSELNPRTALPRDFSLTFEESKELIRSYRALKVQLSNAQGDAEKKRINQELEELRILFIAGCYRLIYTHSIRDWTHRFTPQERVSVASTAILKAMETWDPDMGQFQTYVLYKMKSEISKELAQRNGVSYTVGQKLTELRNAEEDLFQQLGHHPSDEELLKVLGWKPETLAALREMAKRIAFEKRGENSPRRPPKEEILEDNSEGDPSDNASQRFAWEKINGAIKAYDGRRSSGSFSPLDLVSPGFSPLEVFRGGKPDSSLGRVKDEQQ